MHTSSYIDYEEDGVNKEPEENWKSKDLISYWKKLYVKYHRGSTTWGIKETSLLSKLQKVYSTPELSQMIKLWMETTSSEVAYKFGAFYSKAPVLHSKIQPESTNWSWN